MEDFRQYKRSKTLGEGELSQKNTGKRVHFNIMDISASGIRIQTDIDLNVDMVVELDAVFEFPMRLTKLSTNGVIVKKEKDSSGYIYALRFLELSRDKKIEIDELIKLYHRAVNEMYM